MMKSEADVLDRLADRIRAVVDRPGGLDATEVASILSDLKDKGLSRAILAQFLATSCINGDVSEVFAWAAVLSHVEGKRPARDAQLAVMQLIDRQ